MALGDPFVMDCAGRLTASATMIVIFYPKTAEEYRRYRYPGAEGFPQFRLSSVGLENDGMCYQCAIFSRNDLSLSIYGSAMVAVYGQYIAICKGALFSVEVAPLQSRDSSTSVCNRLCVIRENTCCQHGRVVFRPAL